MSQHTPGPWSVTKDIVDRWHVDSGYRGPGSDYIPVADVTQGEPDARLIAAAPRMLAALKLAKECLTMPWIEEHLMSGGHPTDLMLALNNIRAALKEIESGEGA